MHCRLTYGRLCSTPRMFLPFWLNLCVEVEDDGHIINLPRMICMLVTSCLPALTDTRCER